MQKVVLGFLKFFEKLTGKHFIYLPQARKVAGKTAVKSDEGFWYVGDITDTHDLAYGILYNGYVEKEESSLVKRILQKMLTTKGGLNFYDVGANTGYYGIMAAYLGNGTINTYSFEPLPDCVWSIEQSAYMNRLENKIKVFGAALGDKAGSAKLFVSGSGSTLHEDFLADKAAPTQMVSVQTLDEIVEKQNIGLPDFIKIDVEGHELSVLVGAEKTIAKNKPVMFIEIAKTLKNLGRDFNNQVYEKTFDQLSAWRYKVYCLLGAKLVAVDKNFYSDGVHMFLCVPEQMQETIKEVTKI